MSEDRLDRIEKIVESNARAIQALTGEWQEDRKQWQEDRKQWQEDRKQWEKDRKGIYQLLGQLTRSMSDFYEVQSDFYNRFEQIDKRQADITQILRELKEGKNNSD